MVVVPAAKGKTRIALLVALGVLMKSKKANMIVIVYLNEELKEQDEENWVLGAQKMAEHRINIERVVGLAAAKPHLSPKTVLLVDEADKIFIDQGLVPPSKCLACIGFTATIPTNGDGWSFVNSRLVSLGFKVLDHFYPTAEDYEL